LNKVREMHTGSESRPGSSGTKKRRRIIVVVTNAGQSRVTGRVRCKLSFLLFTAQQNFHHRFTHSASRPVEDQTRSCHAPGRDRDTNSGAYARVLSSPLPFQVDLQVAEPRAHARPAVHPSRDLVHSPKRRVSALPFVCECR
jgi:hypothetical protein